MSYQTYTAIAFDIADDKGVQFDGIEDGGNYISDLADYWNANSDRLKQQTEAQTRKELMPLVTQ